MRHKLIKQLFSYYALMPFRASAYGYYRLRTDINQKKFIFILCPMRSGSTLLTHILCSNPDIVGFGETHICYDKKDRFNQLICHNYWGLRKFRIQEKYVIDKIVHKRLLPDPELLKDVDAHYIFLTRNAEQSLGSIVRHFSNYDAAKALDYWNNKMDELEHLCEILAPRKRSIYLTYESLTSEPDRVLKELTRCLDLDVPLEKTYRTNKYTGRRIIGDSTRRIMAGQILQGGEDAKTTALDGDIDEISLHESAGRLKRCRTKLSGASNVVIG